MSTGGPSLSRWCLTQAIAIFCASAMLRIGFEGSLAVAAVAAAGTAAAQPRSATSAGIFICMFMVSLWVGSALGRGNEAMDAARGGFRVVQHDVQEAVGTVRDVAHATLSG